MKTTYYAALVALDWGGEEHAYALSVGEDIETGHVVDSAAALHDWLRQLGERFAAQPIALAIEAGRNAVMHALVDYPWLTIYPVHPATSERFRKAFVASGAKDDLPDAVVLIRILAQNREQLRALRLDTAATRELAALNEVRCGAFDRRTQLSRELRSARKTMFPQALEPCEDDLLTPLALDFLGRWPELAVLQRAKPAGLRAFYTEHNSRRPAVIAQRLERIAAARALTTDRAVLDPAVLQIRLLVAVLRPLQSRVEQVEQRITECFAAHPEAELFVRLPGAGPVLAPRLLVAFGTDRARFPSAASLRKYGGVAPVREKSGRQIWAHWRWNAPKFLRQTFFEWAGQTIPECAWAKAYYCQQKRAGKRHKAILRGLAFKWIRGPWRCWHDRAPYDEARYVAAPTQRNSPLATHLRSAA